MILHNGNKIDKIIRNGKRIRGRLNGKDLETGIITDGLVLWLDGEDFSNSPPTTTWKDRSGKGNDGTANGFAYTTESGSDGEGAVVCDGVDDYIDNIIIEDLAEFSTEIWFKINSSQNSNPNFFDFDGVNSTNKLRCDINSNTVRLIYNFGGTQYIKYFPITLLDFSLEKHCIAVDYNGSELVFSVDNVVVSTQAYTGTLANNNLAIFSGYVIQNITSGLLYDFKLYDRSLTEEERTTNYEIRRN